MGLIYEKPIPYRGEWVFLICGQVIKWFKFKVCRGMKTANSKSILPFCIFGLKESEMMKVVYLRGADLIDPAPKIKPLPMNKDPAYILNLQRDIVRRTNLKNSKKRL